MEWRSCIVAVVQQVLIVLARCRSLRKSDASETLIKVSDKEVRVYPVRMPDSPTNTNTNTNTVNHQLLSVRVF